MLRLPGGACVRFALWVGRRATRVLVSNSVRFKRRTPTSSYSSVEVLGVMLRLVSSVGFARSVHLHAWMWRTRAPLFSWISVCVRNHGLRCGFLLHALVRRLPHAPCDFGLCISCMGSTLGTMLVPLGVVPPLL